MHRTRYWIFACAVAFMLPQGAMAQGSLEGRVVDNLGQALSGVSISFVGRNITGLTALDGTYRIDGIPAGSHEVRFTRVGYGEQTISVGIADGGTLRVNVTLAEAAIAVDRLVVVGSRAHARTATESMVPLDVVPVADLSRQGDTDLSTLIRNVVPSYSVTAEPISDAATLARPASIRNLAPDHTLVLVNGKRRHRSAVIVLFGGNGVADGAQGPDVATLPAIAMSQIEVLRDGASAQYGSDAIAGVINFVPRRNRSGGTIEVKGSGYDYGTRDGRMNTFAANIGLPLGASGFLSLSGEYGQADTTSRSVQRNDAARLASLGFPVRDPAQVWGLPEVEGNLKLFANMGYPLDESVEFYGHGNYHTKTVTGGFYFRNPNTRDAVFSIDGGQTLLVADMLDAVDGVLDGSASCPVVHIVNDVPDPVAWERVRSDPNCFSFQEMFPGGFTPKFGGDMFDASAVGGVRGETAGVEWDASVGWGTHKADFFMMNTINASLGPDTPTDFRPGINQQRELNVNLDLEYEPAEHTHLAGGFEWRNENYEIVPGDRASWQIGPLLEQGFSASSNGFPGFSPFSEGNWDRANIAVYGDFHQDGADERWAVGGAVRFENFDGFGTTLNGKVSGRFALAEGFALRGSASTGFRAPTPGQLNFQHIGTTYDYSIQELVNTGTISPTSKVARTRGGKQLEPETSLNFALGATLNRGPFTMTADYFNVSVSDRITLSPDYNLTPAEVEQLLAEGVDAARNLRQFRFYNNHFSTRTQGVDVVATYAPPALEGNTTFGLLFNHTATKVTESSRTSDFDVQELDSTRIRQLEGALPRTRASFSAVHRLGSLRLSGKINCFSGWFDFADNSHTYSGKCLADAEAAYTLPRSVTLTLGAENFLNTYPDENPFAREGVGNLYSQHSPFGFNGALMYLRASYVFEW